MPAVVFVQPDGGRQVVEAPLGQTVMEVARQNQVVGIVALCGGACACATCHVYVEAPWQNRLPPPEEMEVGMLESAWEPRPNSRLSCQLHVTADLEGLVVALPLRQGVP